MFAATQAVEIVALDRLTPTYSLYSPTLVGFSRPSLASGTFFTGLRTVFLTLCLDLGPDLLSRGFHN